MLKPTYCGWTKSISHLLRNPWNVHSAANTNKQWFPIVSKWCRISPIHRSIRVCQGKPDRCPACARVPIHGEDVVIIPDADDVGTGPASDLLLPFLVDVQIHGRQPTIWDGSKNGFPQPDRKVCCRRSDATRGLAPGLHLKHPPKPKRHTWLAQEDPRGTACAGQPETPSETGALSVISTLVAWICCNKIPPAPESKEFPSHLAASATARFRFSPILRREVRWKYLRTSVGCFRRGESMGVSDVVGTLFCLVQSETKGKTCFFFFSWGGPSKQHTQTLFQVKSKPIANPERADCEISGQCAGHELCNKKQQRTTPRKRVVQQEAKRPLPQKKAYRWEKNPAGCVVKQENPNGGCRGDWAWQRRTRLQPPGWAWGCRP